MRQIAFILAAAALLFGQPEQPVIRTTTSEVVVDVIVRDKKGKLVRGLTAADFSVLEDGTQQKLITIREAQAAQGTVDGSTGAAAGASAPPNKIDTGRQIRLFTLVFDRLGIDSRRLARQAAFDMVKEELPQNVYFAVFYADMHLKLIQNFTSDRTLLRKAIENATSGAPTDWANAVSNLRQAKDSTSGSEGAAEAASSSGGQNVDGAGMAAEAMNRMITDMLDFSENSAREQQGRSSIFSLWGIVREQKRLPGRKTLLYFSEGLQLPNTVWGQFHNMISDANRANVAVYAVDARGLSTSGDNAMGADMMNRNLRVSQGSYRGTLNGEQMTREQIMQFDRALDAIRANPQVALAELAESTGGFLIANSNDFRQPLKRLAEDIGSYYELVYRPSNSTLDGRFRPIEVKVSRQDVKIQARSGYYALPSLGNQSVYPYEVPLLNALGQKPLPRGMEFRSSVVRYRPVGEQMQAAIVFDMPMRDIAFRQNEDKTAYRTHFSFLALVKDERGEVVGKISRDLPMEEPAQKLEGFQQGRAIFTKVIDLRPGRYVLESAVTDRIGERFAARRTSIVVPSRPAASVGLSGITLVRRTDQPPPTPEPDDPFIVPGQRIIPTLTDTIPKGKGNALSLYFVIYPVPGMEEKPQLTMEFFQGGTKLGGGSPELPPVLPDGRIPYIANTPLDGFPAGQYEVRVTARQGGTSDQQSTWVTIE